MAISTWFMAMMRKSMVLSSPKAEPISIRWHGKPDGWRSAYSTIGLPAVQQKFWKSKFEIKSH